MLNNSQRINEYYNLNGYYLRLLLTSQQLSLISFNSILLNGIKYELKINIEDIKKIEKIKNLTVLRLYELITNKINENKFMINGDQNCVILSLLETTIFNPNKDIQLSLPKNKYFLTTEYENVLSNILLNLRQENKYIKSEINEIKNILKGNNNNILNGSNILRNNSALNRNLNVINHNIENKVPNQMPKEKINNVLTNTLPPQKKNIIPNQEKVIIPNIIKNVNNLNISSLANIEYGLYPQAQLGQNPLCKISGYGANSYNGIVKKNNEDKLKIILDHKFTRPMNNKSNINVIYPKINYFAIYDGHGGDKCSNFLQEKLDYLLFNSEYFPLYILKAIYDAYMKVEQEFESIAFDAQKKFLIDKSGSCALTLLILDDWCYISHLGDSRALYSFDSGNQLFQITRDHKPNDPIEKARIEKAGGRIFKDTRLKVNGHKVHVNEQALPGFKFPYRVSPGNLSVSQYNYIYIF